MKNLITAFLLLVFIRVFAETPASDKIFTKDEIKKIAGSYLENKLDFSNPVFTDVDKDGDFDALRFIDGRVEYYMNKGDLEHPDFVLENENYDKYDVAFFADPEIPYPIFFADSDGDKDLDMFVVKDKKYNSVEHKYNYRVVTANNFLNLDTGTLITIILVLVIVILVLAILR